MATACSAAARVTGDRRLPAALWEGFCWNRASKLRCPAKVCSQQRSLVHAAGGEGRAGASPAAKRVGQCSKSAGGALNYPRAPHHFGRLEENSAHAEQTGSLSANSPIENRSQVSRKGRGIRSFVFLPAAPVTASPTHAGHPAQPGHPPDWRPGATARRTAQSGRMRDHVGGARRRRQKP